MNKPELYVKTNSVPQADANYVLNKNVVLLKDNNYAVLDVGCGPGNVTFEILVPLLSNTTKRILGVDISHHHIEYARKYYQNDPRIEYEVLDILTDAVPKDYISTFDLVLSLHCLHFVGNHPKVLSNIYEMMKPNGKMLISFIGKSILNDVYREMSKKTKWKKYMNNVNKSSPPVHSKNYYEILLKNIGFEEIECEQVKKHKAYTEQEALDALKAVNVYPVPKFEELEFIQDHIDFFERRGNVTIDENGMKQVHLNYDLFVFTAKKSLVI